MSETEKDGFGVESSLIATPCDVGDIGDVLYRFFYTRAYMREIPKSMSPMSPMSPVSSFKK